MDNDSKKLQINEQIKSVLTTEVKFIIGIIVFVAGIVAPYYDQKQDIALIQKDITTINSNHMTHIQDNTETIKELKQQQVEMQSEILELMRNMRE